MNIPKFTAQASLYRTSGHYRFSPSDSGGVPSNESVAPAYFPGSETQARCSGCLEGCAEALAYCSIGPATTFATCGWWNPICTAVAAAAQGACNLASASCSAVCAFTTCCPNPCGFPNPFEPGQGCCDRGENCVDRNDPNARQGCCPADQIVCAGRCCPKGHSCCGGECCPPDMHCVNNSCTYPSFGGGPPPPPPPPPPHPFGIEYLCPLGWTRCGNYGCCAPGLECCGDGSCKRDCTYLK